MIQSQALSILKTGANVFLTGEPGSGKTHVINEYVAYLRERGIEPAITASTGIAATHIGGATVHSWSGIGIKTKLDKHDLNKIISKDYIAKRVRRAKVLIIDEVSMLLPETFSAVDAVCREIKQDQKPFGGMQVVLVGDFFQLPPIKRMNPENDEQGELLAESSALFVYDSSVWKRLDPTVCYLTEQYRQDDKDFLSVLSAIRNNTFCEDHLCHLETRKIEIETVPKGAPKLFSHNVDVDRVNNDMLAKLPGESKLFTMSFHGLDKLVPVLIKGCLSPENLCLKIGAAVMFTKNDQKGKFVNGTLGIVEGFDGYSKHPIVKIRNGRRIEVEPTDWMVEENGQVRARITQFPLRLAWAITVHKSQGMSLDEAVMDLSSVFEFGQGYVALSRVRRLSGLYLLGWNKRAFQVHPEILEKDKDFRAASESIQDEFSEISQIKLQKMQEDFITVNGGNNIVGQTIPKTFSKKGDGADVNLEKMRETHPNAYRPWSEALDKKLKEDF
ncbi:MAG: AAA family ATPase, partial [bacterium]|nr:AAA family ATPase [bacterium]